MQSCVWSRGKKLTHPIWHGGVQASRAALPGVHVVVDLDVPLVVLMSRSNILANSTHAVIVRVVVVAGEELLVVLSERGFEARVDGDVEPFERVVLAGHCRGQPKIQYSDACRCSTRLEGVVYL